MTKRQFSILLGLTCQTGCVVYDETLRRDSSDGAIDARRDGVLASRDAMPETLIPVDVTPADVEASSDASADAGTPDDGSVTEDARDPGDASAPDDAHDATTDPLADPAALDAFADVHPDDTGGDGSEGGGDGVADAPFDGPRDLPIVGCMVDFTVSGVTWDEDDAATDAGARGVRIVGDIGSFGAWEPALGVPLIEKAPGAWSASIALVDRLTVEFKFVKMESGRAPQWEQWLPFDSNRSFKVDCTSDAGTVWIDAATEAGPANRAVGRSYGGAFGMRPLDATK